MGTMIFYMISETGAVTTNDKEMAAKMEHVGYCRCTLAEYRAQMCKISKADALAEIDKSGISLTRPAIIVDGSHT
uniref:Uncharacterized protein n=1 Tax=viral metagenome TaxID=1070528 RepID=A0A6M3JBY0_9ZZZZ